MNLRCCCTLLVDPVEGMMMQGLANPKFVSLVVVNLSECQSSKG